MLYKNNINLYLDKVQSTLKSTSDSSKIPQDVCKNWMNIEFIYSCCSQLEGIIYTRPCPFHCILSRTTHVYLTIFLSINLYLNIYGQRPNRTILVNDLFMSIYIIHC